MKKGDVTIDATLTKYEAAYKMAELMSKPGEMISAATAQAKLVGLLRDRVETGNVGDFDGMESVAEILEKVAAERGPAVALELAKLMGLEPVIVEDEKGQTTELLNKAPPTDSVN